MTLHFPKKKKRNDFAAPDVVILDELGIESHVFFNIDFLSISYYLMFGFVSHLWR